jgi:hypothetical protein
LRDTAFVGLYSRLAFALFASFFSCFSLYVIA